MNILKSETAAGPKILLTDSNRWSLSARLAMSLAQAGCQVSAICPTPGHPLLKTRNVYRTYHYSGLRPIQSLIAAIEAADPDVVIPCCDRSVGHLHELYALAQRRGAAGSKLATLIERSLGAPASHATVSSRYDLLTLASDEGIRVPGSGRLNTAEELSSWLAQEPFPWVLKADGTWGGCGVKMVHNADEVQRSFAALNRVFGFRQALKRLLVNRDSFWLRDWRSRSRHSFVAQSYIQGRPANCGVFCWKGRVLAGFGVEVVISEGLTGPASVVRVVDNPEMMFAAERIAARLNLSGFFGLDFMIEDGSGAAYLIEMNPRCTPLTHLRLSEGRDLVGALWAQLAGQPLPETEPLTHNELIAYFPPPVDKENAVLQASFHDVPQDEPELIEELQQPWLNRTFLYRLLLGLGRLKGKPANPAQSIELKTYPTSDDFGPGSDKDSNVLRTEPLVNAGVRSR